VTAPLYEINSFQDIIDKIPPHRVPIFLSEFCSMMLHASAVKAAVKIGSKIRLPLVWKDDGLGNLKSTFLDMDGKAVFSIEERPR